MSLALAPIPETARLSDRQVKARLEAARPGILGALLTAVSRGLARLPETRLERLPRMADFALWTVACGDGALWPEGNFMTALDKNRSESINVTIEADAVAKALVTLMAGATEWTGTAGGLRHRLAEIAGEAETRSRGWPANDRALAGRLRRIAPFLRSPGVQIEVTFSRDMAGRHIHLCRSVRVGEFASFASLPSLKRKNGGFLPGSRLPSHDANHDANAAHDANGCGHDANHDANDGTGSVCVMDKPLETLENDANVANDAKFPARRGAGSVHTRRGVI